MSPPTPISVVIPLYNASARLPALFSALEALDPQPLEFVFVDDGSTDSTCAELQAWKGVSTPVSVARQSNRGPAAARNRGVRFAVAPWIAFTDDDCLPCSDWLGAFWRVAEATDDLRMAFGCVLARGTKGFFYHYIENPGDGHQTANAFYLRSALMEINGFDERFRDP